MKRTSIIKTTKTGWAARVLGTLLVVVWLFVMISTSVNEAGEPLVWQSYVMGAATIILIAGVILAWFKEKAGGIMLIIAGIAFAIWSYMEAGHNEWLAFLISGFPYFIAGILFLISSLTYSGSE